MGKLLRKRGAEGGRETEPLQLDSKTRAKAAKEGRAAHESLRVRARSSLRASEGLWPRHAHTRARELGKRSRPSDLAAGVTIVFVLNAVAIAFFPMLGKLLGFSELQFGAWAALAIHDTSAVLGASLNYGSGAVDSATTIKMLRTLFLVPLMFLLIFSQRSEKKKIFFPFFVVFFSISVVIGSFIDLPVGSSVIRDASQVFLLFGFFAVGTQISKEAIIDLKAVRLLHSITLWALIIPISYFFVSLGAL